MTIDRLPLTGRLERGPVRPLCGRQVCTYRTLQARGVTVSMGHLSARQRGRGCGSVLPALLGNDLSVPARTTLRPNDASAAAARRFVADVLLNCGFPDAAVEHAMLITSELVTHVALHACTKIELAVLADPSMARVEIQDGRAEAPFFDGSEGEGESVWRRRIIEGFADDWGIERDPHGKRVWFEIRP